MKSGITFICSLLLGCLSVAPAHADTSSSAGIRWLCSTEKARWQEQTLAAYALYFSKFVQAWRAEGITLYAMKHASATVLPGARRIAVSGGPFKSVVAFLNRDGSRVLLFANDTDRVVSATLDTGATPVRLDVPAQSMNTVTLR